MRMISKAPTVEADAIILDLEDAVPFPDKETGRFLVKDSLKFAKSGGSPVYVRTNGVPTGLLADDLDSVVQKGLDGIVLPKCQSKNDIHQLERMLKKLETKRRIKPRSIGILCTIETAKGVQNAWEIATASKRIFAIGFGAGDYSIDMGASPYKLSVAQGESEIIYPRSVIAVAARAAGIKAIDTVFFGLLTDKDGFVKECTVARRLGFHGKFLIHPNQVEAANRLFCPSPEDVEYAKRVKQVFGDSEAKGTAGAATLDGRLIDYATYTMAEHILETAQAIAEREKFRKSQPSLPIIPI